MKNNRNTLNSPLRKLALMFGRLLLLVTVMLSLSQCETEELQPVDIFREPEQVPRDTDPIPLKNFGDNNLSVSPEQIRATPQGYHIKGSLVAHSVEGSFVVSSGDFTITNDAQGNTQRMEGYGTLQFPQVGFLQGNVELADVYGAFIVYNTGKYFKEKNPEDEELPLDDDTYYFYFELDNVFEEGDDGLAMIGNMLFNFPSMYLDPKDPAIFLQGDASLYESGSKPPKGASGSGNQQKFKGNKSATSWSVSGTQLGISIKSNLHFNPYSYSEKIEELMGDKGFVPFPGFFFLGGEASVKKYPILIDGRMMVAQEAGGSAQNFFNAGPAGRDLKFGVNGKVKFGHALLDMIPLDLEVELGRATLVSSMVGGEEYLRIAGEYDSENFFKKVLPEAIFEYVPFVADKSLVYLNLGTKPEDWQLSFETTAKLNIPALGQQDARTTTLSFGAQGALLSLEVNLPFNIGQVLVSGMIGNDGTFELKGRKAANVDFGRGLRLGAELDITITEKGLFVAGDVAVPAAGTVKVAGEITRDGMILSGNQLMNIAFTPELAVSSQMDIELNTSKGVSLAGSLNLPHGIGSFTVTGEITNQGIAFTGNQSTFINFGPGATLRSNFALTARTFNGPGIFINGRVDLPANVTNVALSGEISGRGVMLSGEHQVGINFGHGVSINSRMRIEARTFDRPGVWLYGMMRLPLNMAAMEVEGSLNASGLYFLAKGRTNLPFLGGSPLSADLEIGAATYGNPGATIRGSVNLPGNLITAQITQGQFTANGFEFNARAQGNLNFHVTRMQGNLNIAANHRSGISINGRLSLPFGLGTQNVFGRVIGTNFLLGAESSLTFKEGPIEIGGKVAAGISSRNVSFEMDGRACFDAGIAKHCLNVGIGLEPTWGGNDPGLRGCINFPVVGRKCFTIK